MPTPSRAFAVVAHALADVDPEDKVAVSLFYERTFTGYTQPVRELIADFLVGQTDVPSGQALKCLKRAVVRRRPRVRRGVPALPETSSDAVRRRGTAVSKPAR